MAAKFDLDSYKSVQDRITEFWNKFPDGAIQTQHEHYDTTSGHVLFKAIIYSNAEKGIVLSTGYAEERRDFDKQKGYGGKEFESVNYTSHVENAETSSIGRALANAGFATSQKDRPSREEMAKVQRMTKAAEVTSEKVVKEEPKAEVKEVPQEPFKADNVPNDSYAPIFNAATTRVELQTGFSDFQKKILSGENKEYTGRMEFVSAWQPHVLAKLKVLK